MFSWLCSKCGGTLVEAIPSRPSLDSRYATGYCEKCTPKPRQPKDPKRAPRERATVQLVATSAFDESAFAKRREFQRRVRLVDRLARGKLKEGTPEYLEAQAILGGYIAAGGR